jgi:hypothetical protein
MFPVLLTVFCELITTFTGKMKKVWFIVGFQHRIINYCRVKARLKGGFYGKSRDSVL